MKGSYDILGDLRRMMDGFVGETFTEEMRQRIRLDATELMHEAFAEGQAAMSPLICENAGTKDCRQVEDGEPPEIYDEIECLKCHREGGFMI